MKNYSSKLQRRDFLKGVLGLSAAGILHLPALGAPKKPVDPCRIALLADTHINEDLTVPTRGIFPAAHFRVVVQQILSLPQLPVAATVSGDCANQRGKPGDYKMLAKLLKPLREGGIPVYLLLGNHDNRENFWKAFPKQKENLAKIPEEERHVKVLSTENVDLFLLDSLIRPKHTPGRLGKKQLQWVDEKLKEHTDKPVILMAHHDTRKQPQKALQDYEKLFAIMKRHPQVKGYFFGHLHRWFQNKNEGLWEVCIPTTSHVFKETTPTGWVEATFKPKGASLKVHTINEHPKQGEVVELAWRE
ncbi:MAG: metallophosphoesterase [Planctomycetia bacterium]|jgi:3',5'-cyclic AMP phosphodiesterase CpdA